MNNPLNESQLPILRDILTLSLNDKVIAKEYKRKNIEHLTVINDLVEKQLIRYDTREDLYSLSSVGLYLTDNDESAKILDDTNTLCLFFRDEYKEGIEKHTYQDLEKGTGLTRKSLETSLAALSDAACGITFSDSNKADDYITYITENIFRFESLEAYIQLILPSWFPDHYKTKPEKKPNKHSERHSKKREEILGAALSVLANFPNLCTNDQGTIEGRRIALAIDEKYALFFPDYEEPPLAFETSERLINKWLAKAR